MRTNASRPRPIVAGVALCSAGAGIAHVFAAMDDHHRSQPHVIVFFLVLAAAQLGWAGFVAASPGVRVLRWGIAGNVAVVALWLVSRTVGVPLVPGLAHREAVEGLDIFSTLLEVVIVAGCVYLAGPRWRLRFAPPELAAAAMATGLVVLAGPMLLSAPDEGPGHRHPGALHAIAHPAAEHGTTHATTHSEDGHAAHAPTHAKTHTVHVASRTEHAETHAHRAVAAPRRVFPAPRGTRTVLRYGPFNLGRAGTQQGNIVRARLETPCTDCYITAMEPDLVYADGSTANFDTGVMLHHAVLGETTRTDLTCGRGTAIGWMGQRFFAAGNERTKGVLPEPFGYRVPSGAWWAGIFEIMNFSDTPQTVYFELTTHTLPASTPRLRPVVPVWMDEGNCRTSEYSIPAGHSVTTWDWRSSITGRVVFAGGHVHNWGRSITLSNASTETDMCKSVAGYGTKSAFQGNIESMTVCTWDRLGTVRKGQSLRISAVYDAPEARNDAMGIMLAYVYETTNLNGGTPAPSSMTDPSEKPPPEHPSHDH